MDIYVEIYYRSGMGGRVDYRWDLKGVLMVIIFRLIEVIEI